MSTGFKFNHRQPDVKIKEQETYPGKPEVDMEELESSIYYCLITARCKRTT